MSDVRLIAAVGRSGQIGLRGYLPWSHGEDLRRFRELTWGHVVVVGWRTAGSIGSLPNRLLHRLQRDEAPEAVIDRYADRVVWIAGGAATYRLFAPFVTEFVIRQVDFDGPADTFFPFDALPGRPEIPAKGQLSF